MLRKHCTSIAKFPTVGGKKLHIQLSLIWIKYHYIKGGKVVMIFSLCRVKQRCCRHSRRSHLQIHLESTSFISATHSFRSYMQERGGIKLGRILLPWYRSLRINPLYFTPPLNKWKHNIEKWTSLKETRQDYEHLRQILWINEPGSYDISSSNE